MGLIGKKVKHKKFGEGIITKQDASHVCVRFAKEDAVKKFMYPSCFKSFLKLLDAETAAKTEETVKRHEEQEKRNKKRASKEAEERYLTKRRQESGSKSNKARVVRPFDSVADFCEKYKQELALEIAHLKTVGGKRQHLSEGRYIETKNGQYVYSFESDDELNYPEGTQINIWIGKSNMAGQIVGCEDFTIIISTRTNLGVEVSSLEFSAEPWHLMEGLSERLDRVMKSSSEIVRALVCDGHNSIDYSNSKITTGQQTAVQMATSQPITFVWGPPGTGKTQTLAKIASAHIEKGNRVLMLSYSNVSVDGAIMRTEKLSSNNNPGILVRYGYPREKELLEHKYLTSYNLALHSHPELQEERQKLIAERKKIARTATRYVEIQRRLTQIRKELRFEEKESVKAAKFIATTVSKAIVDRTIRDSEFDVVIFDEASMAYIPQIIFSASLAKKHFICMGDFRQLPPIVQSDAASMLNADIFEYCGIVSAVESGRNHKWLCMLDTQYRMHPQISGYASAAMYEGLLHSADCMEKERREIVMQEPISGHAMAFADLSGMMSVCTKTGDGSRLNVLSAMISFTLALAAAQKYEVGVITPYHAQSRLLHAMARDARKTNPDLKPISCATVHQFQGSEKDVILYDAVDCYRMPYPGMLLTSMDNNYANRLFNVALTRAKGKFIGVANISYMDNKNLSKKLMFEQMIARQRKKASCLTGEGISKKVCLINDGTMGFFNKEEGNHKFLEDLEKAQREIRIDIPDKPVQDAFCAQLATSLKKAKKKGIKVYLRAENKQSIPDSLKSMAVENTFVANPIVLIDKRVVWFGMPASDANFKSEGKILETRYRPIIRFEGTHTAKAIYGFMKMGKTIDQSTAVPVDKGGRSVMETFASYVLTHKRCPSCGKPMKMQKSKKEKFFLACTGYPSCRTTSFVEVDFVEKYFYRNGGTGQHCTRCNCSLEAKLGKYGLYIQCCGAIKHRYKLDEI